MTNRRTWCAESWVLWAAANVASRVRLLSVSSNLTFSDRCATGSTKSVHTHWPDGQQEAVRRRLARTATRKCGKWLSAQWLRSAMHLGVVSTRYSGQWTKWGLDSEWPRRYGICVNVQPWQSYFNMFCCFRNYGHRPDVVSNWTNHPWHLILQRLVPSVCWAEHPPKCIVLSPLILHLHCAGDLLIEKIACLRPKGTTNIIYLRNHF